ncbi:hypothetical protein WR164_13780 [Philodulcilactobacillus myokoensis]|uniref:Uncharacterized protein n=1 Tax=Philodulcilactobacillus myokoensis TaxID=2929573 RepID=A0A9W6B4C5_9LACO|nr:hypothetical protein [Philodulcilactobacillus myokoensis]GLB47399.1 hypothetical protein WR164_13780 [Philodulcilactobacillus myokoensis]
MDNIDYDLIKSYFRIDNKIKAVHSHKVRYVWRFWQQSFINSPLNYDSNGNKISIKPFQLQVNDLVDYESFVHDTTDLLRFKKHYFNRYLINLNEHDLNYLKKMYLFKTNKPEHNHELDQQTMNELNQIEEATEWRFKLPVNKAVDITDNPFSNLDKMLGAL